MSYFIIHSGEDGISVSEPLSADEVKDRVTPDENGDTYYGTTGFHEEVPDQSDGHFWSSTPTADGAEDPADKLLIIKGSIVVPQAVEVVTKFDV